MASATETSGVEVWSLTEDAEAHLGERVVYRGAGGSRGRVVLWSLREALGQQSGRLVLGLHTHLAPLALPFVMRGGRFVHVLVGIESWKPLSRLEAAALDRADLLLGISAHTVKEFKKANPRFRDRDAVVCHPGIEATRASDPDHDESYALIVGRMASAERYKGHDVLLEAWPALRLLHPSAKLVIAGDGDDRARLEAKAERLGVERAIRFAGRVTDSELDALYRGCSFFAMPSRHEGFGFVFLEAMRAGKPCIGAPGAASEIIEEGVTGFLVSPDDVEQLVQTMALLWREPRTRLEMGYKAKERFRSRFTAERFRERLRGALRGLG